MASNLVKHNRPFWTQVILVFYINVGNVPSNDVSEYMDYVQQRLSVNKPADAAPWFFIPIRDSETRVECINPSLINNPALIDKMLNELTQLNELIRAERLAIDKPDKFYINKS